jgi:hypothetical protein
MPVSQYLRLPYVCNLIFDVRHSLEDPLGDAGGGYKTRHCEQEGDDIGQVPVQIPTNGCIVVIQCWMENGWKSTAR